ncbi:MAG: phenylalanine--tRNA ligase subunit beta, partial [Elusimicrobiota bacterium]
MKYSLSWLAEFLPQRIPALARVTEALEHLGLGVSQAGGGPLTFEGVVVAQVLETAAHPDADRLKLAKVSDGGRIFDIVCGAANVATGQKVALARIGAKLDIPGKGRLIIAPAKLRGQTSEGMLCSSFELGLDTERSGIMVLPADTPLGTDLKTLFTKDTILDIELPFHRWDLCSHRGLARELALYLWGVPCKEPPADKLPINNSVKLQVSIDSAVRDLCRRYCAILIKGVRVGPSDEKTAARLRGLGHKPINNVVDITNLVMLETGQPLHAFDFNRLSGRAIEVRKAKAGETLKALDEKTYALTADDLVIADDTAPVALAGIIGGDATKVDAQTTDVLLECAWFTRTCVRPTSSRLGVRTDSSALFTKESDICAVAATAARAARMIASAATGTIAAKTDLYPRKQTRPSIKVSAGELEEILGYRVTSKTLLATLNPLAESVKKSSDGSFILTPRSWRTDLNIKEDLAEEVLRFGGFSDLPTSSGQQTHIPVRYADVDFERQQRLAKAAQDAIAEQFIGRGFAQAINFPLIDPKSADAMSPTQGTGSAIRLANPVSAQQSVLRTSLVPGLIGNLRANASRGKRCIR